MKPKTDCYRQTGPDKGARQVHPQHQRQRQRSPGSSARPWSGVPRLARWGLRPVLAESAGLCPCRTRSRLMKRGPIRSPMTSARHQRRARTKGLVAHQIEGALEAQPFGKQIEHSVVPRSGLSLPLRQDRFR